MIHGWNCGAIVKVTRCKKMIASYVQRLLSPMSSKPNEEWLRLKAVIESGDHSGLEAWLREVAALASDLESNFEVASRGGKTR